MVIEVEDNGKAVPVEHSPERGYRAVDCVDNAACGGKFSGELPEFLVGCNGWVFLL